jgi:hypothetical protein
MREVKQYNYTKVKAREYKKNKKRCWQMSTPMV